MAAIEITHVKNLKLTVYSQVGNDKILYRFEHTSNKVGTSRYDARMMFETYEDIIANKLYKRAMSTLDGPKQVTLRRYSDIDNLLVSSSKYRYSMYLSNKAISKDRLELCAKHLSAMDTEPTDLDMFCFL